MLYKFRFDDFFLTHFLSQLQFLFPRMTSFLYNVQYRIKVNYRWVGMVFYIEIQIFYRQIE